MTLISRVDPAASTNPMVAYLNDCRIPLLNTLLNGPPAAYLTMSTQCYWSTNANARSASTRRALGPLQIRNSLENDLRPELHGARIARRCDTAEHRTSDIGTRESSKVRV